MKYFEQYLQIAEMPSADNLTEEEACNIDLYDQFASYLENDAVDDNGVRIKPGTATQHFSGARTKMNNKFRANLFWITEANTFTSIAKRLERNINNRLTLVSETAYEKSPPLGRTILKRICAYYLNGGSEDDMYRRALLVVAFNAVGRSGEVGYCKWANCYWDVEGSHLYTDWNERKVGEQKPMTFVCDADGCDADVFHALACYFITGGTGQHESLVFPKCATSGCGDIINGIVRSLVGKVVGVTAEMTSTSLCVAATNMIVGNEYCDLIHAVVRGGWDHTGLCSIFEYIQATSTLLNVGGRALNGWNYPRKPCYPARLVFVDDVNASTVHNFMWELFHLGGMNAELGFAIGGRLYGFAQAMLASIIQSYTDMCDRFNGTHCVLSRIVTVAAKYGISRVQLGTWSDSVRADWKLRNAEQFSAGVDGGAIHIILQEMQRNAQLLRSLQSAIDNVQRQVDTTNRTYSEIVTVLKDLREATVEVSPTKKRRTDEIIDAVTTEPIVNNDSSSTESAPPINTFSLLANPLTNLCTRRIYRVADTGVELKQLLSDYYEYDLKVACNWDYNADDKLSDRKRAVRSAKQVLDYMLKQVMTEDQHRILQESEPDRHSPQHSAWLTKRNSTLSTIQDTTMARILAAEEANKIDDKKTREKSKGFGAVCNRLKAIHNSSSGSKGCQ